MIAFGSLKLPDTAGKIPNFTERSVSNNVATTKFGAAIPTVLNTFRKLSTDKILNAFLYDELHHEYSFLRAALRNGPTDVTSTVNSAQAPLRHTRASA